MPTPDGKLKPGEAPMTEEKWVQNKSCTLSKREHKWHWKNDPATGLPDANQAICAHCGEETTLTRKTLP